MDTTEWQMRPNTSLQRTASSQKKDVNRYPSPRHGGIGYIWYDLNIDGVVSDLTATFDIQVDSGGLVVVLNEISVI